MIEKLQESHGVAYGFKVTGQLTLNDVVDLSEQINLIFGDHEKPMGLLADISDMQGADWTARWEEMRFLQHHTDHIARFAVICRDEWQELKEVVLVATAVLQAETRYFLPSEIHHAWHWVKMNKLDTSMPVRIIHPGKGLFQNYTPEYMGI